MKSGLLGLRYVFPGPNRKSEAMVEVLLESLAYCDPFAGRIAAMIACNSKSDEKYLARSDLRQIDSYGVEVALAQ